MKIFLSYAREDRDQVNEIYQQLTDAGHAPWIDHEKIIEGEKWKRALRQAVKGSDIFVACLSQNSVSKRGEIQKEILQALDIYDGLLPDDIFLIPVLMEKDVKMPERLEEFQAVKLFEPNGFERLLRAIEEAKRRREAKAN